MQFKSTISSILLASLTTIHAAAVPSPNDSVLLDARGEPKGITCSGSFLCKYYFPHNAMQAIRGYIESIDPDQDYLKDEYIACQDTICARLRKIEYPLKGWQVKDLMNVLGEYCGIDTTCGTIPICAITNTPWTSCRGHLALEWCGRSPPECDGLCARPGYVEAQNEANHNGVSGDDVEEMREKWTSIYNPEDPHGHE